MTHWSMKMDRALIQLARKRRATLAAEELQISQSTVRKAAKRLGLSFGPRPLKQRFKRS
jgi:hypothetical protein